MFVKKNKKKEDLTYYYIKEFDMQEYLKNDAENSPVRKMIEKEMDKIRDEYINEICDELLEYVDRDKVEKIRKMAKNLTKEEFEEMVERAKMFASIVSNGFGI